MKIIAAIVIAEVLTMVGQTNAAAQAIHKKCKGEFSGQPTACITKPRDGTTIEGATVKVTLNAADLGGSHYHLFLDTDVPAEGQAIPEGPGITHLANGVKEVSLPDLKSGLHRLIVVLGDNGHVAVARAKADTAYFTVASR